MNREIFNLFLCMAGLSSLVEATSPKRLLEKTAEDHRNAKNIKLNDDIEELYYKILAYQPITDIIEYLKLNVANQENCYKVAKEHIDTKPELMYKFYNAIRGTEFWDQNKAEINNVYDNVMIGKEEIGKKVCDDIIDTYLPGNILKDEYVQSLLFIYDNTNIESLKQYIESRVLGLKVSINGTGGRGHPIINNLSIVGNISHELLEGNWYEHLRFLTVSHTPVDSDFLDKFNNGFAKVVELVGLHVYLKDTALVLAILENIRSICILELFFNGEGYKKSNFSDTSSIFFQLGQALLSALESNSLNVCYLNFGEEIIFTIGEITELTKSLIKASNVKGIRITVDIADVNAKNDNSLTKHYGVPVNGMIAKIIDLIQLRNLEKVAIYFKSENKNMSVENYLEGMGKIKMVLSKYEVEIEVCCDVKKELYSLAISKGNKNE